MSIEILRRLGAHLGHWSRRGIAGILFLLSSGAPAEGVIIDFGYRVSHGGTPIAQAYDDGRRTYLILAPGTSARDLEEVVKSVAVIRDGKVQTAALDLTSPSPTLPGVYDRIVLNFGKRQAVVTYLGKRGQQAALEGAAVEKLPLIQVGEKLSVHKIPVEEAPPKAVEPLPIPAGTRTAPTAPAAPRPPASVPGASSPAAPAPAAQAAAIPPSAAAIPPAQASAPPPAAERIAVAVPPAMPPAAPPAAPAVALSPAKPPVSAPPAPIPAMAPLAPAMEGKLLPNNQVVRVVARSDDLAPEPATGALVEPDTADPEALDDVAEYKVMIPFALGKTTLGKEGEKAMGEVAQIGPIAREILIRAPGDSGKDSQRAHSRAAEIHRQLVKAGLVRQRISIEAVDGVPNGRIVNAEVALIVDLARKGKK